MECRCFFIKPCYYFLIKNRFYIIFSKRSSHTSAKLIAEKWRNACMIETQNIILKIYVINFPLCTEYAVNTYWIKNWIKFFRNQIDLLFHFETENYSILLALIGFRSFYHLLSFAVTYCHLLSLVFIRFNSLSFVATRCTTLRHYLSFVASTVVICCHPLYHSSPLVVTRCTARLSFYIRSMFYIRTLYDKNIQAKKGCKNKSIYRICSRINC